MSATLVTLHLTPMIATSAATISTTIMTVTPISMRGMKMRYSIKCLLSQAASMTVATAMAA